MKQTILFMMLLCSIALAKENVEIEYTKKMQREIPTNATHILSYYSVLEGVKGAVVNIATQKNVQNSMQQNPFFNDPLFREFFRGYNYGGVPQERMQRSLGSGVIISKDGYIVTNNHVVEGADSITVNLSGEDKEYEAKLIGSDPKSDIAIIKIEASKLNALQFYDSDDVKIGDIVFAIGNPFGVDGTITQGIVSATGRNSMGITEYEDFIQTDASINPGNSGGALINSAGYLIGINAAIVSNGGGNVGIGFAIPSNMVHQIAKELIEKGEFKRAYLGVRISSVSEEMKEFYKDQAGALITSVEENTPAAKAGLLRGDLIIAVDDKELKSASELKNTIGSYPPASDVEISFIRDGKKQSLKVHLSHDAQSVSDGSLHYKGLEVQELSTQNTQTRPQNKNTSGVLVGKVEAGSAAQKAGILGGDLIIQIENQEIKSLKDFQKATKDTNKKRLYIYRQGAIFAVVL